MILKTTSDVHLNSDVKFKILSGKTSHVNNNFKSALQSTAPIVTIHSTPVQCSHM